MKVWRRTETGEAPRWQGATTENIGQYLKEEQRRQRRGPQRGSRVGVESGCIARRMQPDSYHGLLGARADERAFTEGGGPDPATPRIAGCGTHAGEEKDDRNY